MNELVPKLLELDADGTVTAPTLQEAPTPEAFAAHLRCAHFTGKGDQDVVEGMYMRFYLSHGVGGRATAILEHQKQAALNLRMGRSRAPEPQSVSRS